MCYAIPGKVIEIKGNTVTVLYFDQKRKARNDFYNGLSVGDYVYAQGGFVVRKIPEKDAISILDTWRELFVRLEETDLRLAHKPKDLYQIANSVRQKNLGNSCCIHGIIEFSNYCKSDCGYCGIRNGNTKIKRYRMSVPEIIKASEYAINELNFKALVLQSGEDLWYDEVKLIEIVNSIMKKTPIFLILSIGERDIGMYKKLYEAGARGALIRFETSNQNLYSNYRSGKDIDERLSLIKQLRDIGYLIFTGFLVGLPGQKEEDIIKDIELTGSLEPDMFSFGPFIPHPDTPLKDSKKPDIALILSAIARARIMYPKSRILITTALETLDKKNGVRQGLLSGGNSLMINLTPEKYRKLYEIYPKRAGMRQSVKENIDEKIKLLHSIGRAPTDLGYAPSGAFHGK